MLERIVEELRFGKKIALIHSNADADALASAFVITRLFDDFTLGIAESMNKVAKRLAEKVNAEFVCNPSIDEYEKVVVLDTSNPNQLGDLALRLRKPIVIDHHARVDSWNSEFYYTDESKSSCAEIVYEISKILGRALRQEEAFALLVGIITDTGRFKFGNAETLKASAELMQLHDIKIEDALSIIEEELDYSQRVAQLKSAQRLVFESVNGIIIASSQVSAFEASCCSILLLLGADVAFVGSQKREQYNIIGKARFTLAKRVHLGLLMHEIGKECNAEGGGHKGAGGIIGIGDVEAMLNICREKVKERLSRTSKSVPEP